MFHNQISWLNHSSTALPSSASLAVISASTFPGATATLASLALPSSGIAKAASQVCLGSSLFAKRGIKKMMKQMIGMMAPSHYQPAW